MREKEEAGAMSAAEPLVSSREDAEAAGGHAPSSHAHKEPRGPATTTSKPRELFWLCGEGMQLSLRGSFRILGKIIGTWPSAFLVAAAILISLSGGLVCLRLQDRVRDGYTPSTSRSRRETDLYRHFLDSEGDPVMTTVILKARDGGSMHRVDYLSESVELLNHVSRSLTAETDVGPVNYTNFCGHYCESNVPIYYFYLALHDAQNKTRAELRKKNVDLSYPISHLLGVDLHMERNFYGVRTTPGNWTKETNIEHVELIVLSFMAEVSSLSDEKRLGQWELAVYDYATQYKSDRIEMLALGAEIVDLEMNKDSQKMAPYFATGFFCMLVFVVSSVLLSSLFFSRVSVSISFLVALVATMVAVFAISTTLGLNSLLGLRTNSLCLIMPFLIMGIGVNDSFLTVHAWMRQSAVDSKALMLGRVFEEVGPSITTTTLTNVITFAIGALCPTAEIALFCFNSAVALGFAYIYTLILLGPALVYLTPNEEMKEERRESGGMDKMHRCFTYLLNIYCDIVGHKYMAMFLLAGTCVYWYFGLIGTLNIDSRLDTEKILPKETPIHRPNRMIETLVWSEFYPVTVIVHNPPDIRDKSQLALFWRMVAELEAMDKCRGSEFTILWLRDYEKYYNESTAPENAFDFYTDDYDESPTTDGLTYDKLNGFLHNPLYKHYASFIKMDKAKAVPVTGFSFMVVYENNTSWDDRIDLQLQWRGIVDRYPTLNTSVWNVNSMFVDQMLSLKSLALQTGIWTLICMTVVCALFIQNPLSVTMASLAIASISLGTIGYLSWWQLDLDPASLCAVLMSIGMSVDFTTHPTYHFQLTSRTTLVNGRLVEVPMRTADERLRHTIASIAWPMLQAGVSTVFCIIPLVMLNNYIPLVFVKTISLVVIWGLFHGLVLLPCFLAQLPQDWLGVNCYSQLFRQPEEPPTVELQPLAKE